MPERILITGVAGFIGSHLSEHLLGLGYEVTGIDNFDPFYPRAVKERNLKSLKNRAGFTFIEGDAADPNILKKVVPLPSAVIHLAAKAGVQPSLADPDGYIISNILLTNRLLEWMRTNDIKKFVFASSSSVYGNTDVVPFKEEQAVNSPVSPYAFTKRSCELMNYTYHDLYGMDIVNLRFFTVYGERQRPDLAIHKFVKKIANGEPIQIYGEGDTSRDYTYWKDTVAGITASLQYVMSNNTVFETFNLGNQTPMKLLDLVNAIGEAMGETPQMQFESKKSGDVDITYADISKAATKLHYHPVTRMDEGLRNFVKWFRQLKK